MKAINPQMEAKIKAAIAEVPDFPKAGIGFKDITTLLMQPDLFKFVIDQMAGFVKESGANVIVAPEARGFIFAAPVAYATGKSLVLVRKTGKLPRQTVKQDYALEYGKATIEVHRDDIKPGDKVVIIDDILATGGTIQAIIDLVKAQGAEVAGLSVLANLTFLDNEKVIAGLPFQTLVNY